MKPLPQPEYETLLVRTDFSDEEAWQALRTAVTTPTEEDFLANIQIVDDPAYRDLTCEQVAALAPGERLLIVADKAAVASPEGPLLVRHTSEEGSAELRVVAEELWSIENNLSLANMDWEEFVAGADEDGVFRGF